MKIQILINYNLLITCIEQIETKEELILASDYSKKDLEEFVNNLTKNQFNKIIDFFKTMPRIETKFNYTTSDNIQREGMIRGIRDFFQLASATQV